MEKIPAYILIVDSYNAKHAKRLSPALKGHKIFLWSKPIDVLSQLNVVIRDKEKANYSIKGFICSHTGILRKLIAEKFQSIEKLGTNESLSTNYQGAIFYKTLQIDEPREFPILIIPELESIVFRPYGEFLIKRYFRKLWDPSFFSAPELEWTQVNETNIAEYYDMFKSAILIGGDIETVNEEVPYWWRDFEETKGTWFESFRRTKAGIKTKDIITVIPKITLQGYTGIFKDANGKLFSHTIVFSINSMNAVHWMQKFNALPAPKIYQNGRYDSAYHLRYSAPMTNFVYDTKILMHSYYAELPKTLDFISSFFIRNHMYWKDEMSMHKEFYNAQDCHYMTWACIFMLQEYPDWAKVNYKENFPKIFPCMTAEMEGFLIDPEEHKTLRIKEVQKLQEAETLIQVLTNTKWFNASSPIQVKTLLKMLYADSDATDSKSMKAFADKNEFNAILVNAINSVREAKKAIGNYYDIELFVGRYLFGLDPAGTDTGRFSSNNSHFWCGGNIQNVPLYAKSMFTADKGYLLGAIDNSQSESRCTGYIAEELNLIDAVENSKDFHVRNASAFFGVTEEYMFGLKQKGKEGNKEAATEFDLLRNKIGKRLNHGANYNMGDGVLLSTMGAKAVVKAAKALKLPPTWTLRKICGYLLSLFDNAYPLLRDLNNPNSYYRKLIKEIQTTNKLVGATGWTRYCFGIPKLTADNKPYNKMVLNSYIAHPPQSLSVKLINQAYYDTWLKLQIKEKLIRLKPQVHDEIVFQYKADLPKETVDYIYKTIGDFMQRPVTIHNRIMIIPNDQKRDKLTWKQCK